MDPCASPETLEQLLAGTLAEAEAAAVRAHVAGCACCQAVLDRLSDLPELRRWAAACGDWRAAVGDVPSSALLHAGLHVTSLLPSTLSATPAESVGTGHPFLGAPLHHGDLGTLGPYRILAELGRGGMGIVFKAQDPELDRTVALKVLQPGCADGPARARFVREARAAAAIDHVNVVPVYAVWNPAEGPPYLVMQYVEGPTLRARITAEQRLAPREAARIIWQVAEGLAAAHGAGLIHRDIKPANIIIEAARDRAKIVDFGLVRPTTGPGGITQEGVLAGTPEYMSPEQIRDPAGIDRRSDVYGLGVTLYEALTGSVPFRGVAHMVLHQVLHDEPVPPRRLSDSIPRDLETVCLKAMAKEPGRRYQTAQDLGEDLRRWLDAEPIRARPVSRREKLWRWCRRNPRTAALLGTVSFLLVLVTAVSTGAALWIAAERTRADENYRTAEAQRRQAQENLEQALKAVDEMLTQVGQEWLRDLPGVEEVRRDLLQKALGFYQEFLRQNRHDPAIRLETGRAHGRVAKIYQLLGQDKDAEQAYREALAVFEELVHDFPDRPDSRYQLARQSNEFSAFLARPLVRGDEADAAHRRALELLTRLVADFPGQADYRYELGRSHNRRGDLWVGLRRFDLAEADLRKVIDINARLTDDFPERPDYQRALAYGYNNLGLVLMRQGHMPDARAAHDQAIQVLTGLVQRFPKQPVYQSDLAFSHRNRALSWPANQWERRKADGLEAVKLYTRLADDFPSRPDFRWELSSGYNNLGVMLKAAGQYDEAKAAYQEALRLRAKLAADFPTQASFRRDEASTRFNLARLFHQMRQWDAAQAALEETLRIQTELVQRFPAQQQFRLDRSRTFFWLSALHKDAGRPDEAKAAARQDLQIMTELVDDFPDVPDYRLDLGNARHTLAVLLRQPAELPEARLLLEKAVSGQRAVLKIHPNDRDAWASLRKSSRALAETRTRLGQYAEALSAAAELVRVFPERWEGPYDAACSLAQCVPVVDQDERLPGHQRREWMQRYSDQAVVLLEDAIRKGFKDLARLQNDTDLESLRPHPGFQRLLTESTK